MSAPFDLTETDKLLSTTRAVRKRLDLDKPVEREVILDCIRLSMQAPTGKQQPDLALDGGDRRGEARRAGAPLQGDRRQLPHHGPGQHGQGR